MKKENSYVFIAGGMGVTPFRSIIASHLAQTKQLSAVLIHCVSTSEELLFAELFKKAEKVNGITYQPLIAVRFSDKILRDLVPNIKEHMYYLSGSERFISAIREILEHAGIDESQIKTDIFSGY